MAQSWVKGNLPYTELWDLKPPITFLYFALQLLVFGKNLVLIRLMGVLLVAGSAWFTYRIADLLRPQLPEDFKRLTAVLVVLLWSLFGTMQGVMSEHISTFFLLWGLWLLLRSPRSSFKHAFLSGLLMGLAVMAKLNLAYPLLAMGLFLVFERLPNWKQIKEWAPLIAWGSGVVVLIISTYMPYALEGLGDIWCQSVIEAPLAYGDVQSHSWEAALVCLPMAALIILGLLRSTGFGEYRSARLLVFGLLGILFSFIQAGRINGHYLLQAYPFLVLLLVSFFAVGRSAPGKRLKQWALILLLLLPIETYREYYIWFQNKVETGSWYRGESFLLQSYLEEKKEEEARVFYLHFHTTSFLMGTPPVSRAGTHPSNLTRDGLFPYMRNPRTTSEEEIDFIFSSQKPDYVVVKKNKIFFKKFPELNAQVQAYLDQDYQKEVLLDRALVYKRKD